MLDRLRAYLQELARRRGFQYLPRGGVMLVKPTMIEIDAARVKVNEALEKYRKLVEESHMRMSQIDRMAVQAAYANYQGAIDRVDELLHEFHKSEVER